jgi:putative ABC transport system permease protein
MHITTRHTRRNRLSHQSHQGWVLNSLVSGQLALALVLLTGAGLLIRSFVRLQIGDHGFRTESLLTASIALPESQYGGKTKARDFYQQLLLRLASLPGGRVAGMASDVPFEGVWSRVVTPEGSVAPHVPIVNYTLILGDYFQTLGVPLKRGRFFTEADRSGATPAIIVNETLARRFWPGEDAIGKRLTIGMPEMHLPWLTVAGVVGDVNFSAPDEELRPHVYEPYLQANGYSWTRKMNLALRTSGDPLALANAVRREVAQLDPELPVTKLRTIRQILDNALAPRRLSMWLLTVFALAALLLAALGIYGVMAYAVARRTHEIGIRMALGAQRADVLGMIMGQGMKLVAAGLAIGLAASLALTRLMTSLLYDVKPTDPLTYAAVALLLISIALAANLAPARRAVSVDPTVALRHE